jgi:acetyltransferase-like isoleucine patch superfamily enzyme
MIKKILKPIAKLVFSFYFDQKFLKGRLFEENYAGYAMCIRAIWQRNILHLGRKYSFPVGLTCTLSSEKNITFHIDDLNNFSSPGVYFQNFDGHIYLGKGTYIAPNVGIITSNHILSDLRKHTKGEDVIIGENCWIGMNCVVLPGVELGDGSVVAAGSVVTRAFPQGKVLLGGTPAKIIKYL